MEADGEKRFQMGPKVVVHLDIEFITRQGIPPPKDPDEQDYTEHVAFWESILGVHPYLRARTPSVSECYRSLLEEALKNEAKYRKELFDYSEMIDELNDSSPSPFYPVEILPRSPSPRCFHSWHRRFRMTNTNPTSVGSMRFTQPGADEYTSSDLLQFFSMRFTGNFSHGQRMSVYGFVAVRDEEDKLRNYIFNRLREHPQEITPDSPDLLLIPPTRGISAPHDVVVEYSLKVIRGNDGGDETKDDDDDDQVLIDGCFMFREQSRKDIASREVRLFGPLGPLDIRFVSMKFAVEATIQVKVKRAMPGYSLSMVTVSTCGYWDEITLYDGKSGPCPAPIALKDGGGLSSSSVVVVFSCGRGAGCGGCGAWL